MARFSARILIVLLCLGEACLFAHIFWVSAPHAESVLALASALWFGMRVPLVLLITTWLVSVLMEIVIARQRPFRALGKKPLGHFWVPTPSMPSSHAAISFALACPLFIISPWLGIVGLVVAVAVAGSRVYVGVHYVSDVVVGALLGFIISILLLHTLLV